MPILNDKPLLNYDKCKNYGMDDGPNVTINNTIALSFYEIKNIMGNKILEKEDISTF